MLGGYGFIGHEVCRRLITRGHAVIAIGRSTRYGRRFAPEAEWRGADIATLTTPEHWAPLIHGVQAVVNASGALQDGLRDNLAAVQDRAIRALVAACEAGGVRRFVQISAPGADTSSDTSFLQTKAAADNALKASTLDWVVLRPGLVWGRTAFGGTALVRMLSAFPVLQPIVLAESRVQMVDIEDVCAAVEASVESAVFVRQDIDLVEPTTHSLAELIARVRVWHGFAPARAELRVPGVVGALMASAGDLAGWLGWRSPLRTTSLRSMASGVTGDSTAWRALSGADAASLDAMLLRRPAVRQDRVFARTQLLLPLIVLCLAAYWIASGVIGLWRLNDAVAAQAGATGDWAHKLVIGGAVVDIALGLGLLWRPWARAACLGMIALTGAYLIFGTAFTPHLWVDPLGPFVKTLPAAILALVCAALLEER
ncbi:MAG: SDR family oxidoreductase [Phycisphaerales bacterium]|nr:SDR family oxidoreductase [Hyphomonadaceae bacterium]